MKFDIFDKRPAELNLKNIDRVASMSKTFTVTTDISADYRKLKPLEKKGVIRIISIRLENNIDRVSAILPTGVFSHPHEGVILSGSSNQRKVFNTLKDIIGNKHVKDCEWLEAHIRDKNDYFSTEDKDILKCRDELEKKFSGLRIRTVDELLKELSSLN